MIINEAIPQYGLIKKESDIEKVRITSALDAYNCIKKFYDSDIDIYESSFMLLLDRKNMTIGWVKLSQGGLNGTVMDVRLIAKYALSSLCNSVILAHNHPSGNTEPSKQDVDITEKIKKGLEYIEVTFLDNIIISKDSYYSFADNGMI